MSVPVWIWLATIGGLLVLLAIDLVIVDRKPHEVGIGEAARWVTFYVACAVAFGIGIWMFSNGTHAGEYFAGLHHRVLVVGGQPLHLPGDHVGLQGARRSTSTRSCSSASCSP